MGAGKAGHHFLPTCPRPLPWHSKLGSASCILPLCVFLLAGCIPHLGSACSLLVAMPLVLLELRLNRRGVKGMGVDSCSRTLRAGY